MWRFHGFDLPWVTTLDGGKERLQAYRQILMGDLGKVARRPTDLFKVSQVTQGKGESPRGFLGRLTGTYRTDTHFDPEARESQSAVNMAFVNQAAPDLQGKLQSLVQPRLY